MTPLSPWDHLLKQMLYAQLRDWQGLRVLDFGSGSGHMAAFLAERNEVTAVEPDETMITEHGGFRQLIGSLDALAQLPDGCFDAILCHNVLEYVPDRSAVLDAFDRLLAPDGRLSVVKHHRAGRVMQMAVLLDRTDEALALLEGGDSHAARFGTIRYYEDHELTDRFRLDRLYGLRTFWDLQQDQRKHGDPEWQQRMLALEHRVSTMPEYQAIAFFHHLLLTKEN